METVKPKLRFPEFSTDWEIHKLGEISTKINSGKTPLGGESVYAESGILFIRSQNVLDSKLSFENPTYIDEKINNTMKNSIVKSNDILLNITGASLGRSCVVPKDFNVGNVNQHVCIIRLNSVNNSNYIQSILASDKGQTRLKNLSTGSGREGLNFQSIKDLEVYLPSLKEQTRIANFLSSVDEKLNLLKEKKALLEDYKKGIMQKIFDQDPSESEQAKQIRFKDYNGEDFEDWEEKRLGELCDYKNGGSFEKFVSEDGIYNLISLNSIDITGKIKNSHKKVSVTDNSLQKGDLIMVLSDVAHGNFLGLTDIVPDDNFVLNQRMGALKPVLDFNSFYLKTFINFNQSYFKLMGQGSSQQNLSKGDIESFIIKLPCLEEQNKIANFLSAIDEKIELVSNQIKDTQEYKKGLLQQMFV